MSIAPSGTTSTAGVRSPTATLVRSALRLRRTQVGLALVLLVVLLALIGPAFAPMSTTAFAGAPYQPPGGDTPFGTDALGRDVLSRVLSGGRSLLAMSVLATIFGVGLGTVSGLVSAYARGAVDSVLMRINDAFLAFPEVVLVLLAVSTIGTQPWLIVMAVGISQAPRTARIIRGAALVVVDKEFVQAAEASGESRWRIIVSELLPNVSSALLVEFGLRLAYSIAIIAAVALLGFGLQPPAADWGLMINENRLGITIQPWALLPPVLAIGLLTVGANLVTDGIARAVIGLEDEGQR